MLSTSDYKWLWRRRWSLHTHNIVHVYIKHTAGVFIIISLWYKCSRRGSLSLSAGGCAAARASTRQGWSGERASGWSGWVGVSAGGEIGGAKVQRRGKGHYHSLCHTALYWRPIDFISSGRLSHQTIRQQQALSQGRAQLFIWHYIDDAACCVWCWSPNTPSQMSPFVLWWNCAYWYGMDTWSEFGDCDPTLCVFCCSLVPFYCLEN